jgi:hypothetical protein
MEEQRRPDFWSEEKMRSSPSSFACTATSAGRYESSNETAFRYAAKKLLHLTQSVERSNLNAMSVDSDPKDLLAERIDSLKLVLYRILYTLDNDDTQCKLLIEQYRRFATGILDFKDMVFPPEYHHSWQRFKCSLHGCSEGRGIYGFTALLFWRERASLRLSHFRRVIPLSNE